MAGRKPAARRGRLKITRPIQVMHPDRTHHGRRSVLVPASQRDAAAWNALPAAMQRAIKALVRELAQAQPKRSGS